MLYVSILVEALRSRPLLVFWGATLAQTAVWFLVPTLSYPAPPADLVRLLAVGHEFRYATADAPPLAFWLADLAFGGSGSRPAGVYLLSQLCIGFTYWNVLALGRAIVGVRQAVMAVLLMIGIAAFTVPTPDFGPAILSMAIWSLMLLHFWRALGEGRAIYWYALAIEGGLLLLTTSGAVILIGLITLFTLTTARGRAALEGFEPWIAAMLTIAFLFPPILWLGRSGFSGSALLDRFFSVAAQEGNLLAFIRIVGTVVLAHAGMLLLVALAGGVPARREEAPAITRPPMTPFAERYVAYFALVPVLVTGAVAVVGGQSTSVGSVAPLLVLSGLGAIVLAGAAIRPVRQRLTGFAWAGLLLLPALITVAAIIVLPWTIGLDLKINQPAGAMAAFFTESFEHRTGKPLKIVTGDRHLAALVAVASPRRPRYLDLKAPDATPAVTDADIARDGAVVVWPATDTLGAPPAAIKQRFPGLVAEVPRLFERPVQGLLPLMRIGWGFVRPARTSPGRPAQ